MRGNGKIAAAVLGAAIAVSAGTAAAQQKSEKTGKVMSSEVKHGRYVAQTSGCNDCHTPGYPQANGKIEEKLWLTGDKLGWRGPWGTTYPANLRLVAANMTEAQWLARARNEMRPPMPWFNLRDMTERDVLAIYRYLRFMGPAGEPAPAYLPPDRTPNPPFVQFPAPPPR